MIKNFRFQVVLRILILVISLVFLFYLLLKGKWVGLIFVGVLVIIYEIYSLIRYVEGIAQQLNMFLSSIKYDDFSSTFPEEGYGKYLDELYSTFNEIMEKFRKGRADKEEHYRYLQTVVQHIGIGLLVFHGDGKIELINGAAKRMLQVSVLHSVQGLGIFSENLANTLLSMKNGERALVKIEPQDMELALHAAEFLLQGRKYTLVSLQNIQSELQDKELEAWQKLIRVLTHEIMNSLTPITSMTATLTGMLNSLPEGERQNSGRIIEEENFNDIMDALKTINKRSQGLIEFVNAYRNMTLVPKPNFSQVSLRELFERIETFMKSKLEENNIVFNRKVNPETLSFTADPVLIEQVLINLILNSIEALKDSENETRRIYLNGEWDETGKVVIKVIDNGPGIIPEAIKKIFIPFFTTKKKGSGIGLSLSRMIMKAHQGNITVQSEPGKETMFTLKF